MTPDARLDTGDIASRSIGSPMKYEGGYAGISRGEYRLFLVGFTVPLVFGLFSIVFPSFALLAADLQYRAYFILGPAFAIAGWGQIQMVFAGGKNAARAAAAKRRIRHSLVVPMLLIPVGLVISCIAIFKMPAGDPAPAYGGLVFAFIGAAFLPLTAKARRIPWLRG